MIPEPVLETLQQRADRLTLLIFGDAADLGTPLQEFRSELTDGRNFLIIVADRARGEIIPNYYDHCCHLFRADYTSRMQVVLSQEGDPVENINDWFNELDLLGELQIHPAHYMLQTAVFIGPT